MGAVARGVAARGGACRLRGDRRGAVGQLDFDATGAFMGEILTALWERGARTVRAFPPATGVLLPFAHRLAGGVVGLQRHLLGTRLKGAALGRRARCAALGSCARAQQRDVSQSVRRVVQGGAANDGRHFRDRV